MKIRLLVFLVLGWLLLGCAHRTYHFQYGFEPVQQDSVNRSFLKNRLSGSVGVGGGGLISYNEETQQQERLARVAPFISLRYKIFRELSASGTFFLNIPRQNLPFWVSDFFYQFGWYNWRPHTFSFGYENFADNRYGESPKQGLEKLAQGYLFVSYHFPLPKKWVNAIRLDATSAFELKPVVRYFPMYRDDAGTLYQHRITTALQARWTIWKRFYIEGSVMAYPLSEVRASWDPDFTYGFGYFDWRPWRFSLQYGNWVANRFIGGPGIQGYGFLDGNLSFSFNYTF
jgi:hypothetical protein